MNRPTEGIIDPATHIGSVTLAIASLERSLSFYEQVLGFHVIENSGKVAVLGTTTGVPLLALIEQEHAQPQPARTTGLYHFAILVPSRTDLARSLYHLAASSYRLDGYADHLVSEALYLSDPDGNGIEIYRDRPRDTWRWNTGQIRMASDPIDIEGMLEEGRHSPSEWAGLAPQTMIGHMHLRVADIQQARTFYGDLLGFATTAQMPGALFISAGGYHHHLGLNTWQSRNAPRPAPDTVGLRFFTIQLPDQAALQQVQARLQAANIPVEQLDTSLALRDPWGNGILLTTSTALSGEQMRQSSLSTLATLSVK
ncbi:MAG TPA: VOC family protein [Ktedonosporobacter sp.]|nr:VOC family protein [Ktedonosporobacter sp.]